MDIEKLAKEYSSTKASNYGWDGVEKKHIEDAFKAGQEQFAKIVFDIVRDEDLSDGEVIDKLYELLND